MHIILPIVSILAGMILLFGAGSKWSTYVLQSAGFKTAMMPGKGYEPVQCVVLAILGIMLCVFSLDAIFMYFPCTG